MKQIYCVLVFGIVLASCTNFKDSGYSGAKVSSSKLNKKIINKSSNELNTSESSQTTKNIHQYRLIGGLSAPSYFKNYDQQTIDEIANVKTATQIIISYPSNLKPLAVQIKTGLNEKTNTPIEMKEVNLQDTATVKYRHDVVIVILDFRRQDVK